MLLCVIFSFLVYSEPGGLELSLSLPSVAHRAMTFVIYNKLPSHFVSFLAFGFGFSLNFKGLPELISV